MACTLSDMSSKQHFTRVMIKRHVCVENQSDEVDGLGSVSVWCGGMDIKEIG